MIVAVLFCWFFVLFCVSGQQFNLLGDPLDLNQNQNQLTVLDANVNPHIDRREADGWWNLLPFGERELDLEVLAQPNLERQIDLDFFCPFYGFRPNYTFIIPNGILAFSRPEWIQPPYTFPNPQWPNKPDPSFIAPFFADSTFQYIGETRISHVWYRTVHRPRFDDVPQTFLNYPNQLSGADPNRINPLFRGYRNFTARSQAGYVESNELLNNITMDVRNGIIGANGFVARNALIVTWERMAYGGSPKYLEVNNAEMYKRWQNTYQVVLATDEIRSYAIFNYGTINWTASNEAGALRGRGGLQGAIAGFNGGNNTGFTELPYSGQGDIYELARRTTAEVPGRWVYRIDASPVPGGCRNTSVGPMNVAPSQLGMLGGIAVNVSGQCIRDGEQVVVTFDYWQATCERVHMGRARCIMPMIHKIGLITTRMSTDGGNSFPYWGNIYVIQPSSAIPDVTLMRDVINNIDNFDNPDATNLTLTWSSLNLTSSRSAQVRIDLVGYWEDTELSLFEPTGVIVDRTSNSGAYSFDPRKLVRSQMPGYENYKNNWKTFEFGVVRIWIPDDPSAGMFYSTITPFAWYFQDDYIDAYGDDWELDLCIKWFEWDGKRRNFQIDLPPCPCILDQALSDFGRYMPVSTCNMYGDSNCQYHMGALHCVESIQPSWTGAQQTCCYNYDGWLMSSDNYEYNEEFLSFYSPGTPARAHSRGAFPYLLPPRVPSMSHYFNDKMPWRNCCKFAKHCELYYWRRQSNSCQAYYAPTQGFAYGDTHFITFDGVQYTFNGKGYYTLVKADHPIHRLNVQVRMEQPWKTNWGVYPKATVLTGVAMQENSSSVVQVVARSDFRRWGQKVDVIVDGSFYAVFDGPDMKWQRFTGLSIYSPARNMNMSDIIIQMDSGAGIRVQEAYGTLSISISLPETYNQTTKESQSNLFSGFNQDVFQFNDPTNSWKTYGLLGRFNADESDDLIGIGGNIVTPPRQDGQSASDSRAIFDNFGETWQVKGDNKFLGPVLFRGVQPIYNPLLFVTQNFTPNYDIDLMNQNASLIFSLDEVASVCQDNYECKFDYINTGHRELAINTLLTQQRFESLKLRGSVRTISCGQLLLADGAIKTPQGKNYLDGDTVTFTCRPEYFLHGTEQRKCVGGLWTPGWHVWCRDRDVEYALKWLTGILVSLGILALIASLFYCCYLSNVKPKADKQRDTVRRIMAQSGSIFDPAARNGGSVNLRKRDDKPNDPFDLQMNKLELNDAGSDFNGQFRAFDQEPGHSYNQNKGNESYLSNSSGPQFLKTTSA